tara:strand:- start:1 stop:1008 length:1008 start_codon:yes stop_codon:yes gene_type:complete
MAEDILGNNKQKVYRLITDAFTKSSLRRGIRTKGQIAALKSLQSQISSILNNKTVVNNLSTKQFLELQNYANDYLSSYTNRRIEKETPKTSKSFKEQIKKQKTIEDKVKTEQLKQHQQSKTRITVLKPNISDTSKQSLTSLIKSAESVSGVKPSNIVVGSSSKALTPYEIIKTRGNKLNFNLKGYSLFENSAYNSKIHGIANTIKELDEGVMNKKISASEANQIKNTLTDRTVSHKLNQLGTQDQVKQFNRPEYQNSFKGFLGEAFKKYMKVIPVVGPIFQLRDMKKQYESIQEEIKKPIQPLVFKKGGEVKSKPKPYAMGGKVYSNTIRKPKLI